MYVLSTASEDGSVRSGNWCSGVPVSTHFWAVDSWILIVLTCGRRDEWASLGHRTCSIWALWCLDLIANPSGKHNRRSTFQDGLSSSSSKYQWKKWPTETLTPFMKVPAHGLVTSLTPACCCLGFNMRTRGRGSLNVHTHAHTYVHLGFVLSIQTNGSQLYVLASSVIISISPRVFFAYWSPFPAYPMMQWAREQESRFSQKCFQPIPGEHGRETSQLFYPMGVPQSSLFFMALRVPHWHQDGMVPGVIGLIMSSSVYSSSLPWPLSHYFLFLYSCLLFVCFHFGFFVVLSCFLFLLLLLLFLSYFCLRSTHGVRTQT